MDIDLGTRALKDDFKPEDQDSIISHLIDGFAQRMTDIFQGVEIKGMNVHCNPDGELIGKWVTGNMHTMTHQSVLLGVPAMQLEIPRSLRNLLIKDRTYLVAFANCILSTYEDLIVPYWLTKKTDIIINYSISRQLNETKLNYEKLKEMADEYCEWD